MTERLCRKLEAIVGASAFLLMEGTGQLCHYHSEIFTKKGSGEEEKRKTKRKRTGRRQEEERKGEEMEAWGGATKMRSEKNGQFVLLILRNGSEWYPKV